MLSESHLERQLGAETHTKAALLESFDDEVSDR